MAALHVQQLQIVSTSVAAIADSRRLDCCLSSLLFMSLPSYIQRCSIHTAGARDEIETLKFTNEQC